MTPQDLLQRYQSGILDFTHLNLNRPIYARTSAYGHFGRAPERDGGFSWDKTDLAKALKAAVK